MRSPPGPFAPPPRPGARDVPRQDVERNGGGALASGRLWRGVLLAAAFACLATARAAAQTGGRAVELELMLAVDTSASVDASEYRLQAAGIAAAFRDPAVIAAIEAHGEAGIAVAMVHWAAEAVQVLEWTQLADGAGANRIAAEIERLPRAGNGVTTAIGSALALSRRLLETNAFAGRRRVIDVSGDGKNNSGLPIVGERSRTIGAGLTINGLTILDGDPTLEGYYLDHVVGGPGAFVLTADDFQDFARAFREKLLREILTLLAATEVPEPEARLR
jgi:hypothetical protein